MSRRAVPKSNGPGVRSTAGIFLITGAPFA